MNPEYKKIKECFPEKNDPLKFDKEQANKQLGNLKKYIAKWMNG